jgi:hypothetical protein
MLPVHHLFAPAMLGASIVLAAALVGPAQAEDCPSHPESTYTLKGDPDDDRSQLGTLVEPAKARGAVCILAYYDSGGPMNSKMLALRRANWAMEQLTNQGVPSSIIARALRASDKTNGRLVQVILGP